MAAPGVVPAVDLAIFNPCAAEELPAPLISARKTRIRLFAPDIQVTKSLGEAGVPENSTVYLLPTESLTDEFFYLYKFFPTFLKRLFQNHTFILSTLNI